MEGLFAYLLVIPVFELFDWSEFRAFFQSLFYQLLNIFLI